jgi:hypothetical protein
MGALLELVLRPLASPEASFFNSSHNESQGNGAVKGIAPYSFYESGKFQCSAFHLWKEGYSAKCCGARMMQFHHLYRKCDHSLPEPRSITLATTPSFWRGFRRMLPASTTLIGFDGETDLFARTVEAPRLHTHGEGSYSI